MPLRRHRARRSRKPRARHMRRHRVPRSFTGASLIQKPYTLDFKLADTYMLGNTSVAGALVFKSANSSTPFNSTNTSVLSSSSGLTNYYDVAMAIPFTFGDVKNFGSWLPLWDNYRINHINVKIESLCNSASIQSSQILPVGYSIVDRDDNTIPTSITQVSGRQGMKVLDFSNRSKQTYAIKIVPALAVAVANGSLTTTAYAQKSCKTWLDNQTTSTVPAKYFGLKLWIANMWLPATTGTSAFRFQVSYNVSFKSPLLAN